MIKKILTLGLIAISPSIVLAGSSSDHMANMIQLGLEEDYENNTILKYEVESSKTYSYYIKHIDGKKSNITELSSIPGKNEIQVKIEDLRKGIYWIVLESEDEIYTKQLIIE